MVTLQSHPLTVRDVHERLSWVRSWGDGFETVLRLPELQSNEIQELFKIRSEFDQYLIDGHVLEGQVRLLSVNPLLRLSGFNQAPIVIQVEQAIEPIVLSESKITGRLDLLAIRRSEDLEMPDFWVLVVEAKESSIDALQGLAQLLTYGYASLKQQKSVWGLTTNGINYRFVHLHAGQPPQYFLMPELNLLDPNSALQLLQVLKAIVVG
jgi:hypothetical protein